MQNTNAEARYAVLVYQAGIANVFTVDCLNMSTFGRNAKRVCQGSFFECESFALGMAHAGAVVASATCNMAGDVSECKWSDNLEDAPFSEKFRPVFSRCAR